ncbi:hypothetical protein ATCVNEJV2_205R [Acanthocystis turfacea Chlorella virus NE-JV-2]|nr:hypothetical protein ATCVNEJV2_205R [Acanthocystis turfacea Chlorella virus NE-JV-2]
MSRLITIGAIVVILAIIFAMMMRKTEKFAPGADFATLNNIKYSPARPSAVIYQNMYEATYTPKITYGGRVRACPPGTVDVGGKCLTSKFGPLVNGKCPATMIENTSLDVNMQCVARRSKRKLINGVFKCYETEIDTDGYACMAGNDTVFTTREFYNGKWACPTGTEDTGFSLDDGQNMLRQCRILP